MSSDRLGEAVELDQYGALIDAALIRLGREDPAESVLSTA
jgi:hypothetical protein